MDDIDEALTKLARAPLPAVLDGLEARVLAQIATPRAAPISFGVGAVAVAALAIGMVGAGVPATPSTAAPLSPFGISSPLAPSTLLAGTP
jgi:hypothetical protein